MLWAVNSISAKKRRPRRDNTTAKAATPAITRWRKKRFCRKPKLSSVLPYFGANGPAAPLVGLLPPGVVEVAAGLLI